MDTDLLNVCVCVWGGGGGRGVFRGVCVENGGFDVAHLACHAPAHPDNGRPGKGKRGRD